MTNYNHLTNPKNLCGIPPVTGFRSPHGTVVRSPSNKYTDALARRICERIMNKESLESICRDPKMPRKNTIIKWLVKPEFAAFREMYYYARRFQAEMFIDEIIEIADDSTNDMKEVFNKNGQSMGMKPDNETMHRSKIRIDTRKWLAAKMLPRIYGEHVDVHHELTGDLTALLKEASNQTTGLPKPLEGRLTPNDPK